MPEEKSRRRTPYPAEMRERAVRLVLDHQEDYPSQWAAIGSVAEKLSINRETLRLWVRRHNAMAEAFNSLYKWELIYPKGPWTSLDDVEFATMGYIDWFNHRRLHGEITDDNTYVTPAEFEAAYYRQAAPALEAVTQ